MKVISAIILPFVVIAVFGLLFLIRKNSDPQVSAQSVKSVGTPYPSSIPYADYPLSITAMQKTAYPGSDPVIEQALTDGSNYSRYIASYRSDGLKIFGLLTVPAGKPPVDGWPVIIFNHGYIQPDQYRTTERYVAYVDAFARNGYIVFKPDYRGHGNSEGTAVGAYYSPDYTVDVLNAVSTLKRYKDANPGRIGMWGHSMGGNITLRALVVDPAAIKAAVIWGGVVGSYTDLIYNWHHGASFQPTQRDLALRNNFRKQLLDTYGTPEKNPVFWQEIDPTYHLSDIAAPVQLHTGGNDEDVPATFSAGLRDKLEKAGKTVGYYSYPGGDHNISSPNFETAMARSVEFFNTYLKPD